MRILFRADLSRKSKREIKRVKIQCFINWLINMLRKCTQSNIKALKAGSRQSSLPKWGESWGPQLSIHTIVLWSCLTLFTDVRNSDVHNSVLTPLYDDPVWHCLLTWGESWWDESAGPQLSTHTISKMIPAMFHCLQKHLLFDVMKGASFSL